MSHNQTADKKRVVERLQKTPIVELVCKQVGIARATYYRWVKDDPDFADACSEAIDQSVGTINDMAESQLISSIKDKNMSAISFWLRHHHKTYETRVNIQGTIKHQAEALTDEQSELVERALQFAGLIEKGELQ